MLRRFITYIDNVLIYFVPLWNIHLMSEGFLPGSWRTESFYKERIVNSMQPLACSWAMSSTSWSRIKLPPSPSDKTPITMTKLQRFLGLTNSHLSQAELNYDMANTSYCQLSLWKLYPGSLARRSCDGNLSKSQPLNERTQSFQNLFISKCTIQTACRKKIRQEKICLTLAPHPYTGLEPVRNSSKLFSVRLHILFKDKSPVSPGDPHSTACLQSRTEVKTLILLYSLLF